MKLEPSLKRLREIIEYFFFFLQNSCDKIENYQFFFLLFQVLQWDIFRNINFLGDNDFFFLLHIGSDEFFCLVYFDAKQDSDIFAK